MLLEVALAAVLANTPLDTLTSLYWDCDALYMTQKMGGEDFARCLSITYRLQEDMFNNDMSRFGRWWEQNHLEQWRIRGYAPRDG